MSGKHHFSEGNMTKSELRKLYKEKRKQLSDAEIEKFSKEILVNLKSMPIWEKSVFHIFVPIEKQREINTFPIIHYLLEQNKTVVVPRIENGQIENCLLSPETVWTTGKLDIPEPKICQKIDNEQIEIVFLPMLICDKQGNRIGYGGGYYDRFLANLREETLKIGLNYFPPISQINEIEKTDIPLNYCVTPEEIVSFDSF